MSLGKLSTGFDGQIASSLVGYTRALGAFSKTNKYYRGVAESYLYYSIELAGSDIETSLWLLFTLPDRKEHDFNMDPEEDQEPGHVQPQR
jgi:hypothetical protein